MNHYARHRSVIAPGVVTGVDFADSQIEKAKGNAARFGATNTSFQAAWVIHCPSRIPRLTAPFVTRSWNIWPSLGVRRGQETTGLAMCDSIVQASKA